MNYIATFLHGRSITVLVLLGVFGCSSTPSVAPTLDARVFTDAVATDSMATPPTDGAVTPPSDVPTTATVCTAVTRTCADVLATFDSGATGVTVTCDDTTGTFTMRSTGEPNYTSNQSTPNAIESQMWAVTFPLNPVCGPIVDDVIASRGAIGFAINGVPFYGPEDANGHDAVINEGVSFDTCDGHADMFCSYHYHEQPPCVFGVGVSLASHDTSDGHPPVIGYALDGFAIYAAYAADAGAAALDGCNGHTDATRGYHYHATTTYPYVMGCNHGVVSGVIMRTLPLCASGTGDAGMTPPTDAGTTTTPHVCTTVGDCTGLCPGDAMGCTCAPAPPGGTGMICAPACNSNADCPMGAAGTLTCDTTHHVCHP